jgi:hypothetical protein
MSTLQDPDIEELAVALRPSEPLVHGVIRDYIRSLLVAEQEAGRVGLGVDVDRASDYVTRMTLSVLSSPAGVDRPSRSQRVG